MEPQIQYAQTKDGVSIAYWRRGDGPPAIHLPPLGWGHLQLESAYPSWRAWHDALAERLSLIRFDVPGTGLSDRDVADFSLTGMAESVDAVADHLGIDRFVLFCPLYSGALGVRYTVEHSQRVSHLVLYNSIASFERGRESFKGARHLLEENWDVFVRASMSIAFGWTSEEAAWWAEFMKEGISQEAYLQFFKDRQDWDSTDLLQQITVPTLVVQRRQVEWPNVADARRLAAKISGAHLAVLEGDETAPYDGDMETLVATICDFVTQGEPETVEETLATRSPFRTVLFTDVEGSTALTQRLGDAQARELLHEHERITREALTGHGGNEIKTMGDGFMASFGSATQALECAIVIQRSFAEHNESAGEPIKVRIGLNAGEPIAEDDPEGRGDLFGTAVNMAARIAAKAEAGEILVADVVRQLVAGKEFLFNDRGDTELRGFEDPVQVYEVRWREE